MLDEAIEKVEKEIKGPNKAEKLFEELTEKLKEFKEKALKSIDTQKSEK
jgi:ABC-type hemin transport system substrate-binding protein